MKKFFYLKLSVLGLLCVVLTSCLKNDLPELPSYNEALITNVAFEYRFKDPLAKSIDGEPIVKFVKLGVNKVIDKEKGTVEVTLTLPGVSGSFSKEIRDQASLSNIVCICDLSAAAIIRPVGDAPKLGVPGDFSSPREYEVLAADGSKKQWTISIVKLNR